MGREKDEYRPVGNSPFARAGVMLTLSVLVLGLFRHFNARAQVALPGSQEAAVSTSVNPTQTSEQIDAWELPEFLQSAEIDSTSIRRQLMLNTTIPVRPRVDVANYEVQTGDNLFAIADKFGLKPETVLWGNYDILRDNPQFLRPGQLLNILPTDGVYYQWSEGDSLPTVATFFEVEPDTILEFPGNDMLSYDTDIENPIITPETWLIIPGGRRALKDWGPPAITRTNPASAAYYGSGYCGNIYEGAIGTGTFVWPTPARYLSGYDYNPNIHPALDIAGAEGNAVYATDGGVVVFAGWSEYGYGFLIVLDHGTGWQSAYAHLSAVGVTCGQSVFQGTRVGAVGNSGNSSGAHLHFELRSELYGKVNPWNYIIP